MVTIGEAGDRFSHEGNGEAHSNHDDFVSAGAAGASGVNIEPVAASLDAGDLREEAKRVLAGLNGSGSVEEYQRLHWSGNFEEYVDRVLQSPEVTRNAFQRMHDMIMSHGVSNGASGIPHYNIFDDPFKGGADAIYGMDESLAFLVDVLKAGAEGLGPESRIILLHGPVGTAKSTIARVLKNGLEQYSRQDQGELFTLGFRLDRDHPEFDPENSEGVKWCPMNEEPLRIIPEEKREAFLSMMKEASEAESLNLDGDLCPCCRQEFRERMEKHGGDLLKVLEEVRVKRITLSEKDRVGIGSFQPKDEKNQDSTELTGDMNYRKIATYGSDSDPRAFNFDGEFNVANRGMLEFVEVLKLDVAFLYDLLGATQEHTIKPKKFAQTDIDEVIIGHTNEPEYLKLVANEDMEAFRDRTIKVDIPYNLAVGTEQRIYEKKYGELGERLSPHTLEVAAMWAVLTRVEEPLNQGLSVVQKMKLYGGKEVPGFTARNIPDLREQAPREGMHGISPRYIQDTISVALASTDVLTPTELLTRLEKGLRGNALIDDEKMRDYYRKLISDVRVEYEEIVKREVQEAVASDPVALSSLCAKYMENVTAYIDSEREQFGEGALESKAFRVDERLMRSIEERIGISEPKMHDFREELYNVITVLEEKGREFSYDSDWRLHQALKQKVFEDQKDVIKLTAQTSVVRHPRVEAKVERAKAYLIENFGYSDSSAEEVLRLATDIFARGDVAATA